MTGLQTLAHAHMTSQVRDAAVIQTLLGALWSRTMDAADLDRSYAAFQAQALPVVNAGKLRQRETATRYYAAAKTIAGAGTSVPTLGAVDLGVVATATSLRVTGLVGTKKAIGRGIDSREALSLGQALMLGAAKRQVLSASRDTVIGLSGRDKRSGRWARVSDGNPCAFCAMLLGRGPAYSEETAGFEAHDGCGCSAAPVFDTDPTGGWSGQSRKFETLYREMDGAGIADFRVAYKAALTDPDSVLNS